jgi:hypothetical protein
MKLYSIMKSALAAILLFGFLSAVTHADRDHRRPDWKRHPDRYRLDDRYRHDQHYLRRGYKMDRLPDRHRRIHYHNRDYYFSRGSWYRPRGSHFVVVAPPIGIVVPTLPALYTTLWIGGIPYYYANDVYYLWRPDRNGYMVTEPPPNVDQTVASVITDELFIYPKQGQSEQQQADDRYACHSWSVGQTHYDPSQPPSDMAAKELSDRRGAYQRAMRACLEGRGYSVR